MSCSDQYRRRVVHGRNPSTLDRCPHFLRRSDRYSDLPFQALDTCRVKSRSTDGTTNFVHGFPFACVSIGLLYKKEPVIGTIYNPFLDQLYSALKGHGAYLDDIRTGQRTRLPIYTSRPLPSLSSAIVGIEWGSDRFELRGCISRS
jgi:hypothetical protein